MNQPHTGKRFEGEAWSRDPKRAPGRYVKEKAL